MDMKRFILLAAAVLISAVTFAQERKQNEVVWKEMNGVTVPLPPVEHPRLFVRSWEIPALKGKMEHAEG